VLFGGVCLDPNRMGGTEDEPKWQPSHMRAWQSTFRGEVNGLIGPRVFLHLFR
jgi:hypothetical protein